MKYTILYVSFLFSSLSFAEAGKCSQENTDKIVRISLRLLNESAIQNVRTVKMISEGSKNKWSFEQFKKEYLKLSDENFKTKSQPLIDEMTAFGKIHPECDPDGLLAQIAKQSK